MGGEPVTSARALIETVRRHGATIAIDGGNLRLAGPRPLPADVMARLRSEKQMVLLELRAALPCLPAKRVR